MEKYDADGDMTTVHATNRGRREGRLLGTKAGCFLTVHIVLVEQQPTGLPQKHYEIDAPQEVEIPFVPQIDADGTVHDKNPI